MTPTTTATQDWSKLTDTTLYNQKTGEIKSIWEVSWVGTDFRSLASKYPNEASVKNNNPAGITWNANFDKWTWFASILKANWVNFEKGTARPINEWGNYVSFPTVADGMKAYELLWWTDRYQNMTVQQALNTWGTGSLNLWPVNPNSKISQLSPEQLAQIKDSQLKKESPWFYKEIKNLQSTTTSPIATLGQYMKDNQNRWPWYSEEDVKAFNEKIDRFIKNGDSKWMALAFRTNIMNDKDFKQEFDNTKKFTTALDNVQQLISDYEASWKNTNALKAMAEKVARWIWVTTDQALAQLQTQMWFTLANYIKSISGTAASDAEVQRLMGNMASIKNVSSLNNTILNQVRSNADSALKSMIETRTYWMPEEIKYEAFSDVYKKPTSPTTQTTIPNVDQNKLNKYLNIVSNTYNK